MSTIAIYSADPQLRRRLEELLRKEPDLTVIGIAENPSALIKLLDEDLIDADLADAVPQGAPLTPRELEVLAAMADGASNKAIARRLGISFHTAKFHVAAILAKLDSDSRTEAVAKAAHLGLVML
jgi:DNA-binding NarL/FixJ family response regulator